MMVLFNTYIEYSPEVRSSTLASVFSSNVIILAWVYLIPAPLSFTACPESVPLFLQCSLGVLIPRPLLVVDISCFACAIGGHNVWVLIAMFRRDSDDNWHRDIFRPRMQKGLLRRT